MSDYTLYKKEGRRYVPCEYYFDSLNYYAPGSYLVTVTSNGRSVTSRVHKDKIGIQAIIEEKSDEILRMVREQMGMKPASKKLTKKQKEAWEVFDKAMGDKRYCVQLDALVEIKNRLIDILIANDSKVSKN
jgi:hypothetical protein